MQKTPLLDVFRSYQERYTTEAIPRFLSYLEIDGYFRQPPTRREMETLLTMRKCSAYKYVAKELGISRETVDVYAERLRLKLQNITLRELLIHLRE